jgi:hypothetical protein
MKRRLSVTLGALMASLTMAVHAADDGIGSIQFFPEQYPFPPEATGFEYRPPASNGTDVFNGRDSNGNRTFVFDAFKTTTTVGSAQPHLFGGWLGNTAGTISALHIQLYADNAGQLGTLLYSGSYVSGASFKNGLAYTGPSPGPAVDPAYDRNRDFGTRNELYGVRYWFDGATLSSASSGDVIQIATTPGRANGPTCCYPLSDNSVYWLGFSVDSAGGSFGAATNFVPNAAPVGSVRAASFSAASVPTDTARYARSVVINDSAVAALEQALQTLSDPGATTEQKVAAEAIVSSGNNVMAILANNTGVPPVLSPEQQLAFGIT